MNKKLFLSRAVIYIYIVALVFFVSACGKQSSKQVNYNYNGTQSNAPSNSASQQQNQSSNSNSQLQNQPIDVGQCFTVNYTSYNGKCDEDELYEVPNELKLPNKLHDKCDGDEDDSVKIILTSANLPNGPFFSPAGTGCNTSAFLQATYSLKPVDSSRPDEDDRDSSKPNLYLSYQLDILSNGFVIRRITGKESVPSLSEDEENTDNDSNHEQHHKPQPRIYITIIDVPPENQSTCS